MSEGDFVQFGKPYTTWQTKDHNIVYGSEIGTIISMNPIHPSTGIRINTGRNEDDHIIEVMYDNERFLIGCKRNFRVVENKKIYNNE